MRTKKHPLAPWFGPRDGSLFDLAVTFASPDGMLAAFDALFARHGGRNIAKDAYLWLRAEEAERPFTGPADARRVLEGTADCFHVLLGSLVIDGVPLPDLGIYVYPDSLDFDFAPGPEWTEAAIAALIALLASLRAHAGRLERTSAGAEATVAFRRAIESAGAQ